MIAVLACDVESIWALSYHIAVAEELHVHCDNPEGFRSERSTGSLPEKPDHLGPVEIKSEEIGLRDSSGAARTKMFLQPRPHIARRTHKAQFLPEGVDQAIVSTSISGSHYKADSIYPDKLPVSPYLHLVYVWSATARRCIPVTRAGAPVVFTAGVLMPAIDLATSVADTSANFVLATGMTHAA